MRWRREVNKPDDGKDGKDVVNIDVQGFGLNALRCIHANINAGLVSTCLVRMHDGIRMGLGKAVNIAVGTRMRMHTRELGRHE